LGGVELGGASCSSIDGQQPLGAGPGEGLLNPVGAEVCKTWGAALDDGAEARGTGGAGWAPDTGALLLDAALSSVRAPQPQSENARTRAQELRGAM
jgi:hypothetical protein